ncbi:hypothetical protein [Corynebacterium sp. AOP12-C2-36]|uniref:hypothetical protein n=1 Tax=Corynebacterium sp. AOP12-C2-36 TaxID=3457723 RepID=UPI004034D03F
MSTTDTTGTFTTAPLRRATGFIASVAIAATDGGEPTLLHVIAEPGNEVIQVRLPVGGAYLLSASEAEALSAAVQDNGDGPGAAAAAGPAPTVSRTAGEKEGRLELPGRARLTVGDRATAESISKALLDAATFVRSNRRGNTERGL